ncbi:MAG: DUF2927 domain-containing protein [Bacteroidota bacterium]
MRNALFILLFILNTLYLSNCNFTKNNEIELIKNKYSAASINYFYEVALFHHDYPQKIKSISKWKKDIYFSMKGHPILGDRNKLLRVIDQINRLNLPINIYEADKDSIPNLVIYFGVKNQLNLGESVGNSTVNASNDEINNVRINIKYEDLDSSLFNVKREAVILHEIVHSLGFPGHSYTYTHGVLRGNLITELTEVDKQIIKLLYEPILTAGYTGKQFENDFADALYHINSKEKLSAFVKTERIPRKALELIYQIGLIHPNDKTKEACIVKFTSPAFVTAQGDYPPEFIEMIKKAIVQINSSTSELKLVFTKKEHLKNNDGINFTFKKDSLIESSTESTITNVIDWEYLLPRMCKSDVLVKYKNVKEMQLTIISSLYRSICLPIQTDIFVSTKNAVTLKPEYKEILKLYYHSSLPSGFTKSQLREVIDTLE